MYTTVWLSMNFPHSEGMCERKFGKEQTERDTESLLCAEAASRIFGVWVKQIEMGVSRDTYIYIA